jgi:uridine kinase
MTRCRDSFLLFAYWLSPIVILGTYFLGLNDILPIFPLTLALFCVQRRHFAFSGFFSVCAVSAKLSMLIPLPFFLMYFWHNKPIRGYTPRFLQGAFGAALLFGLPFFFSDEGWRMILGNPELNKIISLDLPVSQRAAVRIMPLVYMLALYAVWRVKRLNYDLFEAILGVVFLGVVLLMPASLGWFIWVAPFLALYQCKADRTAVFLVSLFSLSYLAAGFASDYPAGAFAVPAFFKQLPSALYTLMAALGIILCARMWREAVSRNDFFRLSKKPFVIGIAGDSGSGKDTLSDSLAGLFGNHSVTRLSGDDYHHWDRKKPMWKVMTHLNPMANDLESFTLDLIDLIDGKPVYARHYDHATGRMTKPLRVPSNDIIIAGGLHALDAPVLRECYNLSIFLDIDESLRRYFKIRRDVCERGHSVEKTLAALESREADAERFIRPQAAHADLLLSLQPLQPEKLREALAAPSVRMKLVVRSRHILYEQMLRRILVGICGLHLDVLHHRESGEIVLVVEGDCSADDMAQAARLICPNMLDYLDIHPLWKNGVSGVMQLVVLAHINQIYRKQLI